MNIPIGIGKLVFIDRKKTELGVPAWPFLALSFAMLGAGAFIVKKWLLFLIPPCGMHEMLGIPCPTCGVCRMAFAFIEGDLAGSFLVQPFMFSLLIFFTLWIAAGIIAFLFGKLMFLEISPFWRKYLWVPLVVLFLLNWAYLIKEGI